jgi:hypothetical protein
MRSRIEIDKSKIPYSFRIMLGGKPFIMEWHYNSSGDIFTCTLYDSTGNVLVCGEPLIYGETMFADFIRGVDFPAPDLIPLDESGTESTVTWENFGVTVFLTVGDEKKEE